jgi:hydrogenase/urease accessory protein HupE
LRLLRSSAWTLALALSVLAREADAHSVGISRGDYRISGSGATADLVFAQPELASSVPGLDANHDGKLSSGEVARGTSAIEQTIVGGIVARSSTEVCAGRLGRASLVEEDGVLVRIEYQCNARPDSLRFELKVLDALSHGHRHLATAVVGDRTVHAVVYRGNSSFDIVVPTTVGAGGGGFGATIRPLFWLGIEHILSGYDHLLFLFGLILVGGRLRSLLLVVTAFTVAHSITLGVSALGIWTPSVRFIEPAIALSIAYIGIENWFVRNADHRWMITFPFGLVHGFGFAGALKEISMPRSELPAALAAFNIGVEAGQVAVLAVTLPLLFVLRRRQWFAGRGVKAMSGAIALAGLWWFAIRIA